MNKTKIVIVMALLSILTLSAFSAINTNNFTQAADGNDKPSFYGSGKIVTAHWTGMDNPDVTIDAYFAEQLTTPLGKTENGLYITVDHEKQPMFENQAIVENIIWDEHEIQIKITMDFKYNPMMPNPTPHTMTLIWDLDNNVASISLNRHSAGDYWETNSFTVCTTNPAVSAVVTKDKGNMNTLAITVKDHYFDFKADAMGECTKIFTINNNAAGTYDVCGYKVYVDTKGNTQIRECYIVK